MNESISPLEALKWMQAKAADLGLPVRQKAVLTRVEDLSVRTTADGFWEDAKTAGKLTQQLAKANAEKEALERVLTGIALAEEMHQNGEDLTPLSEEILALKQVLEGVELAALYTGEYDQNGAMVRLKVGNGGQDAEDFCGMLLKMYLGWAEGKGVKPRLLEHSRSDVGLKSAVVEIPGDTVYGALRGEHGVHRLIRLSPFNAKNLRQTSFARVEVLPILDDEAALEIAESDLRVDVFRSSGPGGQSVNTTDSAVRITYLPLNLTVTCQNEKSQLQNKAAAMRVLRARLVQLKLEQRAEKLDEIRGEMMENSFGSQIRTYTLHPYKLVKDHRTGLESSHPEKVLSGEIEAFSRAYLQQKTSET